MAHAGPLFKKVSLELGGKNPNIVFADADLEQAVATSIQSSFSNQGEICLCGSRLFVERTIYDEFLDRFLEGTKKLRIGDPQDASTDVGALVSEPHLRKVEGYVELAKEEGGTILVGGKRPGNLPERVRDGYFLEPTVIAGLDCQRRVMQEEIFGPVVTVTPFDSPEEAIAYRQRHALRSFGERLDPGPPEGPSGRRGDRERDGVGQHVAAAGSSRSLRRNEGKRRRARGRVRLARFLHRSEERLRQAVRTEGSGLVGRL